MIDRRALLASAVAAGAAASGVRARTPSLGEALYADVERYTSFGDKRSGEAGDHRATTWIGERLTAAGYHVDRQPFSFIGNPGVRATLDAGDRHHALFPVWPVATTPDDGIAAAIGTGAGQIAVVDLPYTSNATLRTPGYGKPLWRAATSGAAAVIGVTRGPTGEIIALNAVPSQYRWPVPTALIGGRAGAMLVDGMAARLRIHGAGVERSAANIVATRPGTGKAIVVSTPTSGWFGCAGERGTGLALFLMLAEWAARTLPSPLVFLATSGHETEGSGSIAALAGGFPPPSAVGLWLHLGANIAVLDPVFGADGARRGTQPPASRGISASAAIVPVAAAAFAGVSGYDRPRVVDAATAGGDMEY